MPLKRLLSPQEIQIRTKLHKKNRSKITTVAFKAVLNARHLTNSSCVIISNSYPSQKNEIVKILKVCLRLGHQTKDCKSKNTCQKCQKKHHTMLHDESIQKTSEKVQSNLSTKWGDSFCALLPTAMVNVISSDNSYHLMQSPFG